MIDTLSSIIVYFFLGHSGMDGTYCPMDKMDTIENVSYYIGENKGFVKNPNDAGYIPKGMVYPFIKEIALRYPKYKFAAAKYSKAASQFNEMVKGEPRYDRMIEAIKNIKVSGNIIGGVIINYGLCEGDIKYDADRFVWNARRIIGIMRETAGNEDLPFLLIGFPINHHDGIDQFNKYCSKIVYGLYQLPKIDKNIKLIPFMYLHSDCYCDTHHENLKGNHILAMDAVSQIQINHFYMNWFRGDM